MFKGKNSSLLLLLVLCLLLVASCKKSRKKPADTIAQTPQELEQKATDLIAAYISDAIANKGKLEDSIVLNDPRIVETIYEKTDNNPIWSSKEQWLPITDSLISFINQSRLWGLFPADYHENGLAAIRTRILNDSNAKSDRKDAALWSKADVMLTDAFIRIVKDVKLGRLPNDSISQRKDSILADDFFQQQLELFKGSISITSLLEPLEPKHQGYYSLKAGLKRFLDSADYRHFSTVPPAANDRYAFRRTLQTRLYEGGFIAFDSLMADSSELAEAIKKFQRRSDITVDGVAGEGTVRVLNTTDRDRFVRIAISMDRYKLLPEKMPAKYIWVNLPSFRLQVVDRDTVRFISKVVCGKARTRTPVLTSAINELITYPVWVPPPSIVAKEILPALKKSPGYLAKKGFSLLDAKGEEVDPYTVEWSKYNKAIPYRIVQGSGDANAMGVMKFVFGNKYSVYLHDTNQRYLFGNPVRTLSHGCVRVQDWHKLASYIIQNDRTVYQPVLDSLDVWLARKEKHSIPIRNKLPVFLRYFTCEGNDGRIIFYDDIYGEDKSLREKYFVGK